MKLFLALFLVGLVAALGKAVASPRDVDAVQTRHYAGNKYVSVSAAQLGDEPAVSYYLYPTGEDVAMHEYDRVGAWIVEVEWAAGATEPKWSVWLDECGWGCDVGKGEK